MTDKETALLHSFPKLTEKDLKRADRFFPNYIFYESKRNGRRLWTNCCKRKDKFLPKLPRTLTEAHYEALSVRHGDSAPCPFCGAIAIWRSVGIGRRYLREYRPVVFLHARAEDEVFAQAYWLEKDYRSANVPEVLFHNTYNYYFTPGAPIAWGNYSRNYVVEDRWFRIKMAPFTEWGLYAHGVPYSIIGLERLKGTFLQYSGYQQYRKQSECFAKEHSVAMKYFMLYCLYPQMEMLAKMKLPCMIDDLLAGKKNAAIIDWNQKDPRKAFGVNATELRRLCETRCFDALEMRNRLRRKGFKIELADADTIKSALRMGQDKDFISICGATKVKPLRLFHWLEKHVSECHRGGMPDVGAVAEYYFDYIRFCEALGYNLSDEMIALPPDLQSAHDRTAAAVAAIKREKANQKTKELYDKLDKLYSFSTEHYLIRPPIDAQEIVAEGKKLRHCVGGYADRHLEGKTTILFLREKNRPGSPLVTIEIKGSRLVQVHGYRNEREACVENPKQMDPRKLYAEILTPWLAWVEAGSKRKKTGEPILPKKERKTA